METKYTFTVITACYNVENYLDEAVQSLLNQDVGFEEHVQLILVDDGSTDNTGAICDKYARQYPDNIEVIHQSNAGVSAARNAGMRFIRGKYVNFLDSDDKLSHGVCRVVYDFLKKNIDEVDMVVIPMFFFDAAKGGHPLNYKFKNGSRIINLDEEPACIQLSLSAAFVKAEMLRGHFFDTRLSYSEDAKVALSILSRKRKLGVIDSIRYMYRRRSTSSSAIQGSLHSYSWYLPWNRYYLYETIDAFKDETGRLPGFVQHALMYDLQWRFTANTRIACKVLTEEEFYEWRNMLFSVLKMLDDTCILQQKHISRHLKAYLLCKKYGSRIHYGKAKGELSVFVEDCAVYTLKNIPIYLHFLRVNDNSVILEGEVRWCCGEVGGSPPSVILVIGNEEIECKMSTEWAKPETCFDEPVMKKYLFCGEIRNMKSRPDFIVELKVRFGEYLISISNIITCCHFPVSLITPYTYCSVDTHLVSINLRGLRFQTYGIRRHLSREFRYLFSLFCLKKTGASSSAFKRILYWVTKPFMHKDIWLISDRVSKANDNGEAFFRYIIENNLHPHVFFIIHKDSPDFKRLKKIGPTIQHMSMRHILFHLNATHVISSAADPHLTAYPKQGRMHFFVDLLYRRKFVFLQHGIIKDDLSGWLSRIRHNIQMMVTSTQAEYDSIVGTPNYCMGPDIVKLTGLARYDNLMNRPEKYVIVAPTWRKEFANHRNYAKTGTVGISQAEFLSSKFFHFYSSLLNDNELIKTFERKGYKFWFVPHPNLIPHIHLFNLDPRVRCASVDTNYSDVFKKGCMLITDYSSVAFDFAYLRKPVAYCQFDKEEFFSTQYKMGYFDYERDGFGEVTYNLESARLLILEYLEHSFRLKDVYRQRIDSFYAYNDRNNCKRIYDCITKL